MKIYEQVNDNPSNSENKLSSGNSVFNLTIQTRGGGRISRHFEEFFNGQNNKLLTNQTDAIDHYEKLKPLLKQTGEQQQIISPKPYI